MNNINDNGKSGQILQLVGDKAHIEFDEGGTDCQSVRKICTLWNISQLD